MIPWNPRYLLTPEPEEPMTAEQSEALVAVSEAQDLLGADPENTSWLFYGYGRVMAVQTIREHVHHQGCGRA